MLCAGGMRKGWGHGGVPGSALCNAPSISFGSRVADLHFPKKLPRRALSCCSGAGQPVGLCL